jgi:DNA ligase-1
MSFIKWITALLLVIYSCLAFSQSSQTPELLLANIYENDTDVSQYWISEKYDGVRAYWNGKQLISRQGIIYHAPDWFIKDFPKRALDGELWIARSQFETLVSTVRKQHPVDAEWKKVYYMIFELPNGEGTFTQRLEQLQKLLDRKPSPFIKLIRQFRLANHKELINKLNEVVKQGAEGLMMHRADALYHVGRNDDLLKVKTYQDTEARVIKHILGKGKYTGLLGSLLVENVDGKRFRVGTGFSDLQRQNPPPIGSIITYKYYGLTKNGIPRFASFLRIRGTEKTNIN